MSYKITIPKPCSEDWNKMTATQKGAFCNSCAKEVIDFTHTTKSELSRKIKKGDTICGRFKPEQLNTPLSRPSQTQFRRNAAMLGFTSLLALGSPLIAQQTIEPTHEVEGNFVLGRIAPQPIEKEFYIITGTVNDTNNLPLPGVNIILKGSTIGTQTDMKGRFSITVPNTKEQQKLFASYIGFYTKEIIVKKNQNPLCIKLEENMQVMGEVVIMEYPVKKTDTIKKLFRRKK
ncbi:carboxypeptidase-like regulatory domain-containing protein [uncultured Croceitalea sp.]|uniref:carboxypeptidase-like regulatory domain-containing protein n=1 Tax=uncultured Croceitalea sp. TaxID=1798908 RepID=UPI0033064ADF